MIYPCERDIAPVGGRFTPCAEPAARRVWVHVAAGSSPLYSQPERWDELGWFCAECLPQVVQTWQRSGAELIVTAVDQTPAVNPRYLRARTRHLGA
jgi:hypothetical protein